MSGKQNNTRKGDEAMTSLTLKNDFHDTEIRLASMGNNLSPRQVRRAHKALCGIADCKCGGSAGERGPQAFDDGRRFYLLPRPDGGANIELD
jgi:hypothetical protein